MKPKASENLSPRRGSRYGLVLLACVIGLGFSLALFASMVGWEERYIEQEFAERVEERVGAIRNKMGDNLEILESIRDFYTAGHHIELEEFQLFCRGILKRRPYILALQWVPRVPRPLKEQFETYVRAQGYVDFAIAGSGHGSEGEPQREYFPGYYLEPFEYNKTRYGFDYASDPLSWGPMQQAMDEGTVKISSRAGENRSAPNAAKHAVLFFIPIYRQDVPLQNEAERREYLTGFVVEEVNLRALVETALRDLRPGIEIEILNGAAAKGRSVLYRTGRLKQKELRGVMARELERETVLEIAGERWVLRGIPGPSFLAGYRNWDPWLVLILGLFLTFFLASHLLNAIHRTHDVERLVVQRTAELSHAVHSLEEEAAQRRHAQERLALQYGITRILEDSANLKTAAGPLVRATCEALGWQAGALWQHDGKADAMRCVGFWAAAELEIPDFMKMEEEFLYGIGAGLPGRVWQERQIVWIPDIQASTFPYAAGPAKGELVSAMGVPVKVQNEIKGVLEFFSVKVREKDDATERLLSGIASHVGDFIQAQDFEGQREDYIEKLRQTNLELARRQKITYSLLEDLENTRDKLEAQQKILERANKRLQELGALKDDFVAHVSHELRTPLTAIKEGISLLMDEILGPVSGEQQEFLKTIDENVERLNELVNNLLDLSKIEAGRLRLARRPVGMKELLESMLKTYGGIAGQRMVTIDFEGELEAFADSARMMQVLANLFSNAVKFTAPDGMIRFRVRREEDFVRVEVIDDGIGIAEEDLPKLFQKFSQVGKNTPQAKGTGLGLVVCREILELHRGTIEVVSEPGKGSTFSFRIPAYRQAFALEESFREMKSWTRGEEKNIGVLVFDCRPFLEKSPGREAAIEDAASERRRLEELAALARHHVYANDIVTAMDPGQMVVFALCDEAGVRNMISRLQVFFRGQTGRAGNGGSVSYGTAFYPAEAQEFWTLYRLASQRAGFAEIRTPSDGLGAENVA